MKRILTVLATALLVCGAAQAETLGKLPGGCGSAAPGSTSTPYMDSAGNECVSSGPPLTTFQGTMTLSAATSTTLTSGNVTMASSTVLPATFTTLYITNTGPTNAVFVCWFGGTASATSGCQSIAAGASDKVNLGNFATPPTLFSTSGTTIAFHN